MLRLAAFFTLIAVFAWLMPLGAFIGSSQEKTACGGHRAFHMCSMFTGAVSGSVIPDGWSAADPHPGAKASAGTGGDDMLLSDHRFFCAVKTLRLLLADDHIAYSHFTEIPAPPPKAAFIR